MRKMMRKRIVLILGSVVLVASTAAATAALWLRQRNDRNIRAVPCLRMPTSAPISVSYLQELELWSNLRTGGRIMLLRHALTEPGSGDPPGVRLDDRSTQRNLSREGVRQAKEISVAIASQQIPIECVLSSPWFRCRDTAQLAFAQVDVEPAFGALAADPQERVEQVERMRRALHERRPRAGNLVIVTHQQNITALTDIVPQSGEMIVLTPQRDGSFTVDGQLNPQITVTTPASASHQ